ncbi:MAG: ribonuclease J [Anaerolineae bacterium]|nr:ribonuclease J [Anaerolineae bacterium]
MNGLRIVPLGGLGEVGKNMMCVEYDGDILVIDVGIMFPESDMLGVDYVLPDWGYLRDKKDRVLAVAITHGHQDHIGGLAHFLEEFDVPVYATRLTRGLIEVKLRRSRMMGSADLHTYAPGDVVDIGPFTLEPYHVCHSIPDAVGLGITTPSGLVVHSGDFKFDHTPVDRWPTDYAKMAEFSGRGVKVLLSDSTYSERPGITPSEADLNDAFDQVMLHAPGRIIVATFASLISRIQQVVDVAAQHDRKIAIAGRAMAENTKMASQLGYLHIPEGQLIGLGEIEKMPDRRVVIMATGTQGEPTAVLSRLAVGQHRSLNIKPDDTVVLSSHTIPGNEEMIHRVINQLIQRGAHVYYDPLSFVHVSGHASQEEQKLLINLLQPQFFVPIHGELRHLIQHGRLAESLGLAAENIAVVENGNQLTFDEQIEIGDRVPGGYVLVDGTSVGETGPAVMREREELAQGGFVVVAFRYNRRRGRPIGQPRITTRGFVFAPEADELLEEAHEVALSAATVSPGTPASEVEEAVKSALAGFFRRKTQRRPFVSVIAIDS